MGNAVFSWFQAVWDVGVLPLRVPDNIGRSLCVCKKAGKPRHTLQALITLRVCSPQTHSSTDPASSHAQCLLSLQLLRFWLDKRCGWRVASRRWCPKNCCRGGSRVRSRVRVYWYARSQPRIEADWFCSPIIGLAVSYKRRSAVCRDHAPRSAYAPSERPSSEYGTHVQLLLPRLTAQTTLSPPGQ